uniref:DNA-directed DNA polymerase n=1 Tax=Coniophora olivacea TaxID=85977 RepID=A0A896Z6A3_9AGAM
MFQLNIDQYPTVPSLAFALFRKNYLKDTQIAITVGKTADFIRESFTGGSTEMYIPFGENVYVYDINSLYPAVMKNNKFPVGQTYKFVGDITELATRSEGINGDYYWIGEMDVETR